MKKSVAAAGLALAIAVSALSSSDAQAQARTKGYIEDTQEFRNSLPKVPRFRNFLPVRADLSRLMPPVASQGSQGSCTTWAVGYYMRGYYEALRRGGILKGSRELFSPAYLYNLTRRPPGDCSQGTSFEAALNVLVRSGIPSLADFPYSDKSCSRLPDETVRQVANNFRIDGARIFSNKLDDIKGMLASGHPVGFGMVTPPSFDKFRGRGIYHDVSSHRDPSTGHAMVLVGYDDEKRALRLVNSWGDDWGDQGYAWISYDTFLYLSRGWENAYAMTLRAVTPPQPAPQPEPQPAPQPVPQPGPQPVPAPPVVVANPAQIREAMGSAIAGLECSRVAGVLESSSSIRLSGYAGDGKKLEELLGRLRALPGVTKVSSDVALRPWPQCEVLLNFEAPLAASRGLGAAIRGGRNTLGEGDSLAVEVRTPDFPSYLYVTYLQASGEAVHLSWPQGMFPKPVAPNTQLVFGGGQGGQPTYRIGAPFGDEMIVVIASASPLFPEGVPKTDDDRDYLSVFRAAFLAAPKGGGQRTVSAVALPLKTQSKP